MELLESAAMSGQPPIVSGYEAVRVLGCGAQGQVWLMAPHDGGPPVAAKIFPTRSEPALPGIASPACHNESQITQEWRVLTQFSHEHLLPVRGVFRDSHGALVLLMAFAAGGDLGQIVRAKGPLTVGEVVTILTPLGQVLAFLHARGAVHGDVSAGNVLLSAAGKPFLGDFGLAKLVGQAGGAAAGTPGFVCAQDTGRTEASDVYGLAAVGWFALTGATPPPSRHRMPLTTLVHGVPTELVAALETGLSEDPRLRPSAAAFAQAVFRSARAEPVALAHAVHPSVLPELLTRQDVKAERAARWGGKFRHCPLWRPRRIGEPAQRALPRPPWRRRQGAALRWQRCGQVFWPRRRWTRLVRLWGDDGHSGGSHRAGSGRRRATVAAATMLAVLVLVACAAIVGSAWFKSQLDAAPTEQSVATQQGPAMEWADALPTQIESGLSAQDPVEALTALAWTRSFALSQADASLLAKINAPGSPALAVDVSIVATLTELGHRFAGLETKISQATLAAHSEDSRPDSRATIYATVITSSFAELDAQGTLMHLHSQEQRQELGMVLTRLDDRWVIEQVLPGDTKK